MKKLLVSLAITSMLSASAHAINAKEKANDGHAVYAAIKGLNLSEQQKQDIKQIRRDAKQDMRLFKGDMKQTRQDLRALMQAQAWDELAVRAAIEEQMEESLQTKLIQARSQNLVFKQLTAEQRTQLKAQRLDKRQKKNRDPEKRTARLFEALDLNSAQASQLRKMMQTNKAQRKDNTAKLKALRLDLNSLVQADNFDEDAWLAVHANNKQSMLEMAVARAKSRFDMLNILDSQQREKLNKIMHKAKHRKMQKYSGRHSPKHHSE